MGTASRSTLVKPGKPTDNAFVESFNGRLRDECLNTHWLLSRKDARAKIDAWRWDYNESLPHTSPSWLTPVEYAAIAAKIAAEATPKTHLRIGGETGGPSESFNGRLRDECLNTHWFLSLVDARAKIDAWWRDYNESRPHTSLGWLTSIEYAAAAAIKAAE